MNMTIDKTVQNQTTAMVKQSETVNYFEKLLKLTGGFGRYQILILFIYALNTWTVVGDQMFMVFGGTFAGHTTCNTIVREGDDNRSKPVLTGNCSTGNNYSFYSIVNQWSLNNYQTSWIPSLIIMVEACGILTGPFIVSYLSDSYGRRSTLISLQCVTIAVNLVRTVSYNPQMFTVLMFFSGAISGSLNSVNYVFFIENCPNANKMLFVLVGWVPGCVVFGLLAYLTQHWITLTIATTTIIIPALVTTLFVKESAKWLVAKGRYLQATTVWYTVAAINKHVANKEQITTIMTTLQSDKRPCETTTKLKLNYRHLFYSVAAVKANVAMTMTWLNNVFIYNATMFYLQTLYGDIYVNYIAINALCYIPNIILLMADSRCPNLGRRSAVLFGMAIQLIAVAYIAVGNWTERIYIDWPLSITTFAIIGMLGNAIMWIPAELVLVEYYPAELRTMGYTWTMSLSKVGSLLSPLVMQLYYIWGPIPYLIFVGTSMLNVILAVYYFPETKNHAEKQLPNHITHLKRQLRQTEQWDKSLLA